jgi:hypothetical protein
MITNNIIIINIVIIVIVIIIITWHPDLKSDALSARPE